MRLRLVFRPLRLRRNSSRYLLSAATRALCVTGSHRRNAGHYRMLVPAGNPRVARLNPDDHRLLLVRTHLRLLVPGKEILRVRRSPVHNLNLQRCRRILRATPLAASSF